MSPLETELAHLMGLMAPPFFHGWKDYCWSKAKSLAETGVEYAELPARLAASVRLLSSELNGKPSEPQPMGIPVKTPALTPMTPRKGSTGQQFFCSPAGG